MCKQRFAKGILKFVLLQLCVSSDQCKTLFTKDFTSNLKDIYLWE